MLCVGDVFPMSPTVVGPETDSDASRARVRHGSFPATRVCASL